MYHSSKFPETLQSGADSAFTVSVETLVIPMFIRDCGFFPLDKGTNVDYFRRTRSSTEGFWIASDVVVG